MVVSPKRKKNQRSDNSERNKLLKDIKTVSKATFLGVQYIKQNMKLAGESDSEDDDYEICELFDDMLPIDSDEKLTVLETTLKNDVDKKRKLVRFLTNF